MHTLKVVHAKDLHYLPNTYNPYKKFLKGQYAQSNVENILYVPLIGLMIYFAQLLWGFMSMSSNQLTAIKLPGIM